MTACLAACMQHTDEQKGRFLAASLDITHWIQATFRGVFPSDGRAGWPPVGPVADNIRSYCREVTTFWYRPKPYSP